MSAHPRRPEAGPIIVPITMALDDHAPVARPEPRLSMAVTIPPSAEPLELRIAWYPPMHAGLIVAGPGECRFDGINGWVGLITLRERAGGVTLSVSSSS